MVLRCGNRNHERWEEFMNAESWAEIRLAPITARFEGTATLHG